MANGKIVEIENGSESNSAHPKSLVWQREQIEPNGTSVYELQDRKRLKHLYADMKYLWGLSTRIAVVNTIAPIQFSHNKLPCTPEIIAAEFPFLRDRNVTFHWVRKWPGTIYLGRPYSLRAMCPVVENDFASFMGRRARLFWRGPGGWEDLMLFCEHKLIFYVCSHERFGEIFGSDELFAELAVKPKKIRGEMDLGFEVAQC